MADLKRRIIAEFSAKNKAKGEMAGFRRDMDKTGQAMKRMAVGALSLAGVGGFGYLAKSMIKAASSAEETQAKFDTVFKNLSGQANIWAESFGKSVGRSERDVKSWMAGLQDTFVPLGISRDEALKLAQSLTILAVDVASFNDAADADVIRDFTSALVGNHETVRKFGIIISETALKQEAMRQGIDKTYKNLTDLEKVQLRYNLILSGTSDAQGDAMRTADSYANQVKRLYANMDNLKVSMGEELLPTFTEFVKLVNENEKAMVAFSKAILAPVKSLLYLIDIVDALHEVQKAQPPGPSYGWGPSGFKLSYPTEKPQVSPKEKQGIAKIRAMVREGERISKEASAGKGISEVIRFEEPEWLKATLALNVMTEAQKKAEASMYEMSMKARGLGEELAREKKITQFAALAKVRYGADVTGAQAAEERFARALKETEAAQIAAAAEEKKRADALAVAHKQMELEMERWDDVARAMESSFANAFEAMAFEAKKFRDVMKTVARDILMEMMRIMMFRPAAQALAAWIPVGVGAITGIGTVGAKMEEIAEPGYYGHEGIPKGYFPPRLHGGMRGGLKTDEFLAVIQRGETEIIPRGESGPPSFTFIMQNQTGTPLKMEQQRSGPNPREFILAVVADDAVHGGVLADIFQTRQG